MSQHRKCDGCDHECVKVIPTREYELILTATKKRTTMENLIANDMKTEVVKQQDDELPLCPLYKDENSP